jgi:hypothetical protein
MRQLNNKGQVTDDVRSGKVFFFGITQVVGLLSALNHGYYFWHILLATTEPCSYLLLLLFRLKK